MRACRVLPAHRPIRPRGRRSSKRWPQRNPADPEGYQVVATYYFEKVRSDQTLSRGREGQLHPVEGIAATDRALALQPDFVEALVYKNLLLRTQAEP